MQWRWVVVAAACALSGCLPLYPGPSADYDLASAKAYYRGTTPANPPADPETLTLEQLYAAHRYGLNKMHPARSLAAEFARRGATAAPFLRAKLEQQQSFGQVASIFEALKAMQEAGSYDVRSDPQMVALIERMAVVYEHPSRTMRDMADELLTGTRIPFWFQPYWRKPLAKLGKDYDSAFAEDYCRRCSFREYVAGMDALPIERVYALQRYLADKYVLTRNVDHMMAKRGPAAAAFLKGKLAEPGSDIMVWTILSTFELMRDLGTYDVVGDAELMRLAEASVQRVAPEQGPLLVQLGRLKTGQRLRILPKDKLPMMGS